MNLASPALYVTVPTGLEKLSHSEILEKFSPNLISTEISAGRIIITLNSSKNIPETLKDLITRARSIEHLHLIIFSFHATEKDVFNEFVCNLWKNETSFMEWINIFRIVNCIKNESTLPYRINVKENKEIDDKNIFARKISESIDSKFHFLCAELKEYALIFSLEKICNSFFFTIKLTGKTPLGLHISNFSKKREKTAATMRPSLAYSLLRLLEIENGDFIIDPMAGSGMFCELAIKEFEKGFFFINCEIEEEAGEKMKRNMEGLEAKGSYFDFVLCNSKRTPFRKNIFDKLICDLPFGKRCGSHSKNKQDYPHLGREFNRIIKVNRIGLMITTEKSLMSDVFKKKNLWKRDNYFMINKGGLEVYVFLCYKIQRKEKKKIKKSNLDYFYF